MPKRLTVLSLLVLLLTPVTASSMETDLIVNFMPGHFLFSTELDGHLVYDGSRIEKITGYVSNAPVLAGGIGMKTDKMYIDFVVGVGYLFNNSFKSLMYTTDLALRYRFNKNRMTVGPHIGITLYDPEWSGDVDVSLSQGVGMNGGITCTVGTRPFSIFASLDYVSAAFDVEVKGKLINQSDLDLSGFGLQVGSIFRF